MFLACIALVSCKTANQTDDKLVFAQTVCEIALTLRHGWSRCGVRFYPLFTLMRIRFSDMVTEPYALRIQMTLTRMILIGRKDTLNWLT